MDELLNARERLADAEANLVAGLGGAYGDQTVAALKARVARLGGSAAPAPSSDIVQPTPAAAAPPASKAPPQPTSKRAESLTRLANAYGLGAVALERAIASDVAPDVFALACVEHMEAAKIAARIAVA